MTMIAGMLAFIAGVIIIYGLRLLLHKDIDHSRFGVLRYNKDKDKKTQELNKKSNIQFLTPIKTIILVLIGVVLFFGASYIFSGNLNISLLFSTGGLIFPKLWVEWQKSKQKNIISSQVEQALETMSTVIKSGGGMQEALDKAVKNSNEPIKSELEQTLSEMKLGISEDEAFLKLSERMDVPEISMLNVASMIRKEGVTVNMAKVFIQIQSNIRQRQAFEEEIKALTSENRMAVWIVAAMPFFTVGIIRIFGQDFVEPLFSTFIGLSVLIGSVVLIVTGIIWALRIADSTGG